MVTWSWLRIGGGAPAEMFAAAIGHFKELLTVLFSTHTNQITSKSGLLFSHYSCPRVYSFGHVAILYLRLWFFKDLTDLHCGFYLT